MKSLLIAGALFLCGASHADTGAAVRNPFWPIGYEGAREVISDKPRPKPKPSEPPRAKKVDSAAEAAAAAKAAAAAAARAEAERRARGVMDDDWGAARRALRIGGTLKVRDAAEILRSSVMINGNAYVDGDLVSFTYDGNRFTWRVSGLTDDNTLKLIRVKARRLEGVKRTPAVRSANSKGAN